MFAYSIKMCFFGILVVLICLMFPVTLEQADSAPEAMNPYTVAQQLFRQGYFAFRQHDDDTAIAAWRRFLAEAPDSLLHDSAAVYLGRSLLRAGHPADARTVFEACAQQFPDSQHAATLPFLIAESYYAEGNYAAALQQYQAFITAKASENHDLLPEATAKSGRCYERLQQTANAWKTYHQGRLKFSASPLYATLKASEDALTAAHPDLLKTYAAQTRFADVDKLLKSGRAQDAHEILLPLTEQKLTSAERSQLLLKLGQVAYALRDNEQARVYFSEFLDRNPTSKSVPYVLDRLARLHLRQQDLDNFQTIYDRLRKAYPQNAYTAGVMRLKGKELQLLGAYKEALAEFALFLKEFPKSALVPEILWYIGWTYYQAGNYAEALKTLTRLNRIYPKSDYRDDALYWAGKSAEHLGKFPDAVSAYHTLRERARRSYYGFLAQEALDRLSRQYPDLPIPVPTLLVTQLTLASEPTFSTERAVRHDQAAQELTYLDLHDLAAGEFAAAVAVDKADPTKYLALARFYNAAGQYRQQMKIMHTHFWKWITEGDDSLPAEFWQLAYPQSFAPVVNAAINGSSVDPLLVYALIFAESVFDPDAYSPAGASGLMQLMPYTGARMAGLAGIPVPEPIQYFQPDINITLGVTYLARLFDLFQGFAPPVIASYNAGEAVVSTWWKAEHQAEPAAFIAAIPYQETKNYAQKVLWYYQEYQRIYRKQP